MVPALLHSRPAAPLVSDLRRVAADTRPTFGINLVPDTAELEEARESLDLEETRETSDDAEAILGILRDAAEKAREGLPSDSEAWNKIWMPRTNAGGTTARFNDFEKEEDKKLAGFFNALVDTVQNRADTELSLMPGYRDRIVHILLDENEGGLNLDMPAPV